MIMIVEIFQIVKFNRRVAATWFELIDVWAAIGSIEILRSLVLQIFQVICWFFPILLDGNYRKLAVSYDSFGGWESPQFLGCFFSLLNKYIVFESQQL